MKWFPFSRSKSAHASAGPVPVGLVLGGGAVRGAAHLGVLSVLEEAGFRPSFVAGTSVGAIVGAGVAAGVSAAEMWEVFRTLDWRQVARPSWGSRLSALQTGPLGDLIARVMRVETIEELDIPFAAVACDLLTGRRVAMTSGDLGLALRASASIPVVFEPVAHEGMLLVDGAVVDNLPVDVVRELGAERVLAVDVMPALDGTFTPKDVRDVMLMTFNIVERNTGAGRMRADLVLTPNVSRVSPSDFRHAEAAYHAGVATARFSLPKVMELMG